MSRSAAAGLGVPQLTPSKSANWLGVFFAIDLFAPTLHTINQSSISSHNSARAARATNSKF
jgi:hypothetical protein